jgi:2-oxo-3-hexenedioate decarboxylase
LDDGRQVAPLSARWPDFTVADGYRIAGEIRRLRERRGEMPLGRKIGFTNRHVWTEHNLTTPIWGDMWDRTVHDLPTDGGQFALSRLIEPRIEPEIVFGLRTVPQRNSATAGLIASIAWVALGFELVQSVYPGWAFAPADAVAAFGVHGALLIGERYPVGDPADWLETLAAFTIALECDGDLADRGSAEDVLGGPLFALRHLVHLLADHPEMAPLRPGEIITTGTLTRAHPIAPGQAWTARLSASRFQPISVTFT